MAASGAGALPAAAAQLEGAMAGASGERREGVKELTGLFREAQAREMAEESIFRNLLEILRSASSEIEQTFKDPCESVDLDTCLLLIAECFRCLRNACVECAKNQNVMRNLGLISTSVHLIKLLHGIQIKEELVLTALRCSLQFLGNIAAGNGDSQDSIWKCAFPDLFSTFLAYSDEKIVAYCCMVLFTCLNSEKVRELLKPGNLTVALHVLKVYKEQLESEWSFLIVTDHLLKCPELVKALYAKLSNQERVILLELMMAKVSEKNLATSEEMNVLSRNADFLARCFQEKCEAVLKLTSAADAEDEVLLDLQRTALGEKKKRKEMERGLKKDKTEKGKPMPCGVCCCKACTVYMDDGAHIGNKSHRTLLEALVAIRLLDVLCEMTSNNGQLEHLQALPGLLETAIDTLRLTHLAGKQAVNIFTATHAMTGQEEIAHPAVGFKSHLIRLIGNLCYKNKENQDRVYELDGIPLILDNCSIDDNNPFVNQWAVYAIRNLTEQNERNQELIAQMEEKGLADNSALESMGLEVEKRDDKLILRSVRKKKP